MVFLLPELLKVRAVSYLSIIGLQKRNPAALRNPPAFFVTKNTHKIFMRPRRALIRIGGMLCILLVLAACSPTAPSNELVIGMDLSYPPFETIQPDGSPGGVSVQIAEHLGAYLHRPIRIENIPFIGLIPSLRSHKIDLIISSMTDTPERRKSIEFSEPYLTIGLALLSQKGSGIHSVHELNFSTRKVAVRQGTTAQIWALKNLPQALLLAFEKESAAVREVAQGKADAFLYDQMSVWKYSQLYRDKCEAQLMPFSHEEWAIGLRIGDTALKDQVNAFLQEFRQQGGFYRLGNEYLMDQKRAFRQLGIPFYF